MVERVRFVRERDCGAGERLGRGESAGAGEHLRPHRTPEELGQDIVRRRRTFALLRVAESFLVAPLRVERFSEETRRRREVPGLAHSLRQLVDGTELALGRRQIAGEQLDPPEVLACACQLESQA